MQVPEVDRLFSVTALGVGAPGIVNQGLLLANLVPEDARERTPDEIVTEIDPRLQTIAGIEAFPSTPSGFTGFLDAPLAFVIEGEDLFALKGFADEFERRLAEIPGVGSIRTDLKLNKPQLDVEIDRNRASDLGVSVRDVASTLQILLGGLDLSTFKLFGETYDVVVQLDRRDRNDPRDLVELVVRGNEGRLIPLSSMVTLRETIAPREIPHYNRRRAVTISADLDERLSQGEGIEKAAAITRDVLPPEGYAVRFTGEAEKFLESGQALLFAYVLAVLVVYLVLAAQFESFVHPFTILVAVAFAFTGALVSLKVFGATLNLFSKIGLVMLVGLVTKNSILIVEFARRRRAEGASLVDAAREAAEIRFRPVVMTAFAFILGVVPLVVATGAGAAARRSLGTAVFGGMLVATVLSLILVPGLYVVVQGAAERVGRRLRRQVPVPGGAR
jgi:multidrug efflux pump